MGIRTTRLPSEVLKHNYDFFKTSIDDLTALAEITLTVLDKADELFASYSPLIAELKKRQLRVQLNEIQGKLNVHEHNLEIYENRVEMYKPVLEKETQEANKHWDMIWDQAVEIAKQAPMSLVAMVLNGYPKEQYDPEMFSQELKNETYKTLRNQIKSFRDQLKGGKNQKAKMSKV